MKNIIKFLCMFLLIISIIAISIVVLANLLVCFKIMFFGMKVGNANVPDSIWFKETTLLGIEGIKTYYSVFGGEIFLIFELPISLICILYQIIYFKIIKRKL